MTPSSMHTFHIPVMGLGYTIDTPVKVARFGISSVVSIIEDGLIEQMRKFYCEKENEPYTEITSNNADRRALRITAYLNLLDKIVKRQVALLKTEAFHPGNDIVKYFTMLPDDSQDKIAFNEMMKTQQGEIKDSMQAYLRSRIIAGSIDVNIMTKCDRINYSQDGTTLPVEYADAMSALRGFAKSNLNSSVVFSAGMNPRLYSYCETFEDMLPDNNGNIKKKIILKVSDFRSASIQGKFLAKKGLWISEFRIESGLNCGGHAFPTDGYLLGPILEEFRQKKNELTAELFEICNKALADKKRFLLNPVSQIRTTVQGGIGTAEEDKFLREYFKADGTGWGSPFLLVPEATNVDEPTLQELSHAKPADYFLSHASPLGIPFNNFRKSSSEKQRIERIVKGRPGSPCYKKFLAFNTEFTKEPICSASREYQNLKLKQINSAHRPEDQFKNEFDEITEKDCLCEGLAASVLLKNSIPVPHNLTAVTICPGPNLAFFSGVFSLEEMIGHIYGRKNILNKESRPHMFIKELEMYVEHLKKEVEKSIDLISEKQIKYFSSFKANLLEGIEYYNQLLPKMNSEIEAIRKKMEKDLQEIKNELVEFLLPDSVPATV